MPISSAIMTVLNQTTAYLGDKYRKLGRPDTAEESAWLQEVFSAVKPQDMLVDAAALTGDLQATKAACRALIAAYRHHWKW